MDLTSALEFARQLVDAASREKKVKTTSLEVSDNVIVKARFKLNSRFVDVFYNSQTGTTAYALIDKGKRVFGADNTGGWHVHPKSNPESHRKCRPISFENFLKRALEV